MLFLIDRPDDYFLNQSFCLNLWEILWERPFLRESWGASPPRLATFFLLSCVNIKIVNGC